MKNLMNEIEMNNVSELNELLSAEESILAEFEEDRQENERVNENDLDFYTHDAMDAMMIMQDEFKREQI